MVELHFPYQQVPSSPKVHNAHNLDLGATSRKANKIASRTSKLDGKPTPDGAISGGKQDGSSACLPQREGSLPQQVPEIGYCHNSQRQDINSGKRLPDLQTPKGFKLQPVLSVWINNSYAPGREPAVSADNLSLQDRNRRRKSAGEGLRIFRAEKSRQA